MGVMGVGFMNGRWNNRNNYRKLGHGELTDLALKRRHWIKECLRQQEAFLADHEHVVKIHSIHVSCHGVREMRWSVLSSTPYCPYIYTWYTQSDRCLNHYKQWPMGLMSKINKIIITVANKTSSVGRHYCSVFD